MKDSLKYLKDDVADIMRRHYDRIQDVHAETRREIWKPSSPRPTSTGSTKGSKS